MIQLFAKQRLRDWAAITAPLWLWIRIPDEF